MGQQPYGLLAPGVAQTYVGRHSHLRHPAWTPGGEATAGATQDYPRSRIAQGARGPPNVPQISAGGPASSKHRDAPER